MIPEKNISDSHLVEGCKRKERVSQELLYKKYSHRMLGVCWAYTRNNSFAEEVLQEGFIRVFTFIEEFQGQGSLEGWIRRIMINTALNHYKQRQRFINHIPIDDIFLSSAESNAEDAISAITEKELLTMIRKLPDKCRLVLNLYALEGYSHEEICTMLDISVGTSKSQLNYARKKLREKITESVKIRYSEESIAEDGRRILQFIQA